MYKFLRIRKAKNGYIFKKRSNFVEGEEPITDRDTDYEYELVHDDELNQKFGEAFDPSSISDEDGEVVICMDFCTAKVFDKKNIKTVESEMKARQMFAMYQHEKFAPKDVVVIKYEEKEEPFLECYDDDAERVNRSTRMPIMQKDGVRYVWLADTIDNRCLLGTISPHVITTTRKEVMKWYEGTRPLNT